MASSHNSSEVTTLRFVSYNCNSLKSRRKEVYELCENADFVLLQEHWLRSDEIAVLKTIHPDFDAFGVSAVDIEKELLVGRPYGGVAILFRKCLLPYISQVEYKDPRIIAIKLCSDTCNTLVACVYLPYDVSDNFELYVDYLGRLQMLIEQHDSSKVIIAGDFNAHPSKPFGREFLGFTEENSLCVCDLEMCDDNTFTCVSDAHGSTSWLDHVVVTQSSRSCLHDVSVLYEVIGSDHRPLTFMYDVNMSDDIPGERSTHRASLPHIDWKKCTRQELGAYLERTEELLSSIVVPNDLINCSNQMCTEPLHRQSIDILYEHIIEALRSAADSTLKSKSSKCPFNVPGWNDHVADLHHIAREAFLMWRCNRTPRQGPLFEAMRQSRARFKHALRLCRRQEEQLRADAIARDFIQHNTKKFWSKVKNCNEARIKPSSVVEGVSGSENICAGWADYYNDLFNCLEVKCDYAVWQSFMYNQEELDSVGHVTPMSLYDYFMRMPLDKAPGHDGVTAEHFKLASGRVFVLLSLCLNAMFVHNHIPVDCTKVALVPIPKSKGADLTCRWNYRPIALASVVSKVIERVLISSSEDSLVSSDHQFGFKANHSTESCIFVLKQVVDYYNRHGSPVFACFLDASKAYDRVNHDVLFRKLALRKCPSYVIRLLANWYGKQESSVRWDTSRSDMFRVSNGVRQGGVMSPLLYNVYIDELNRVLSRSQSGCTIEGRMINNISYADDMVILAPSVSALQDLINVCEEYALKHDIMYNANKSMLVVMKKGRSTTSYSPIVFLNGRKLRVEKKITYLGHMISHDCCDNLEIKKQYRSLCARANTVIRKFASCSEDVKVRLFNVYCTNFYCLSLYQSYTKKELNTLRVCYNNAFRRLLRLRYDCSASQMFVTRGTPSFGEIQRKGINGVRNRLSSSTNVLVRSALSVSAGSALEERWMGLLCL